MIRTYTSHIPSSLHSLALYVLLLSHEVIFVPQVMRKAWPQRLVNTAAWEAFMEHLIIIGDLGRQG